MSDQRSPHLETVVMLMVGGQSGAKLAESCRRLGIPEGDIDLTIAEAKRRLTIAASTNRDEELGKAKARLDDLYTRAMEDADWKTAIQAQKELNRLLDLYGAKQPIGRDPQTSSPEAQELDAIRAHLAPLKLTDREDYPLRELARIAADRIRECRK